MTTSATETTVAATSTENKKRSPSIRTNTLEVGRTYDFEIYNNGQKEAVLRKPAKIVSIPFEPLVVKDMAEDDAVIIQVEGEDDIRRLVRNENGPFYLITRVENRRNSRVRFHSIID